MVGVYLGINAIKDAYLLVEGPDCTYLKTEFIQGNHDLMANLTSVSGFHRITNTALHPSQMASSREDKICGMLTQIAASDFVSCVFLTSMPMAFITGADYDRLCRSVAAETGTPAIAIPGKSLSHDWLNGYAEVQKAIAKNIPLSPKATGKKPRVGIVGYLFDRNEEDHFGNIRELQRMIEGIGAEISSIWFSGNSFHELARIEASDIIVSLPYGRFAAKHVARKLGVPCLTLDYPFGLTATETWLRTLGRHLGLEDETTRFLDAELGRIVPKLEWAIPAIFLHKTYGYIGDPVLVHGFKEIAELLGGKLEFAFITSIPANMNKPERLELEEDSLVLNPSSQMLFPKKVDLIVSNSVPHFHIKSPFMEFGFPSFFTHCLYDRPFLGINGFVAFVDLLLNHLRRDEISL